MCNTKSLFVSYFDSKVVLRAQKRSTDTGQDQDADDAVDSNLCVTEDLEHDEVSQRLAEELLERTGADELTLDIIEGI